MHNRPLCHLSYAEVLETYFAGEAVSEKVSDVWGVPEGALISGGIVDEADAEGGEEHGGATEEDGVHGVVAEEAGHDFTEAEGGADLGKDDEEVEDAHIEAHAVAGDGVGEDGVGHGEDARPGNSDCEHGEEQEVGTADKVDGEESEAADGEANGVNGLGAVFANEEEQEKGKDKCDAVVGGETDPAPLCSGLIFGASLRTAEYVGGDGGDEVNPHTEEAEPGEELHHGELFHGAGHGGDTGKDFTEGVAGSGGLFVFLTECLDIFGRVFAGREDGIEDCDKEDEGADIKGEVHGLGNGVSAGGFVGNVEPIGKDPGERGGKDGAEADKEALHCKAGLALFTVEFIADKGAEGLHADIDGGIEDPEQPCRHPKGTGIGHGNKGKAGENCTDEEIGSAATEEGPGAVAVITDQGLDDQTGEGGGEPKEGNGAFLGAEVLVDGAHIRHLEAPAELDPEEPETHVPDLPEGKVWFVHIYWGLRMDELN